MTVMPSWAIVFLFESGLRLAAIGIVSVSCGSRFLPRIYIIVLATEFLAAFPAPTSTTATGPVKLIRGVQATRKNIVTCRVF
jgi:hypothetical protein